MILKNLQIVTNKKVIRGYIEIEGKKIKNIVAGDYQGTDTNIIDGQDNIAFSWFSLICIFMVLVELTLWMLPCKTLLLLLMLYIVKVLLLF
jgi:hypothetical protein